MSKPNISGRNNPNLRNDSESSSQGSDLEDDNAQLRKSSDGKKSRDAGSGKKEQKGQTVPAMRSRARAGTWVSGQVGASTSQSTNTDKGMSGVEDASVNSLAQAVVTPPKVLPRTTTTTTTTTTTSTTTSAAQIGLTVSTTPASDHSKDTKTIRTKDAGASGSKAKSVTPSLNLTSVTGPDPTETPKTPRTARGAMNSSALLTIDGSTLRRMGQGKTDMRLPEFDNMGSTSIAKSESLAAQLVIADSQWFQAELNTSKADTMLRENMSMKNPKPIDPTQQAEENPIARLLVPFIRHHFKRSNIPTILEEIKKTYEEKFAADALKMYRRINDKKQSESGKGGKFTDHPEAKQLMEPLIKPLLDCIKGSDSSLLTSGYPAPLLNLLVHLADWTRKWQETNSTLPPEKFATARMNALKSFASTRSFMTDFTKSVKVKSDEVSGSSIAGEASGAVSEDYYLPLLAFLNSSVTRTIHSLLQTIIEASDEDKKQIQRMADVVELGAKRSDAAIEKKLDESRDKVLSRKPALTTQVKDLFSGRIKTENMSSPRPRLKRAGTFNAQLPEQTAARKLEKKKFPEHQEKALPKVAPEEDAREKQTKKTRERVVRGYFNQMKEKVFGVKEGKSPFDEWSEIIVPFITKISSGSRADYDAFKTKSNQIFLTYLEEFIRMKAFRNQSPSEGLHILLTEVRRLVESQVEETRAENEKS